MVSCFPQRSPPPKTSQSFPEVTHIDYFPDGKNLCLIDSVGSQSNRIEPIFGGPKYAMPVPQIVVKAGEKGDQSPASRPSCRRCAGAMFGTSEGASGRIKAVLKAMPSRWRKSRQPRWSSACGDSRDTQAKLPRLFASNHSRLWRAKNNPLRPVQPGHVNTQTTDC